MAGKIKKHQRALLAALITVCMGLITIGGAAYFKKLQENLRENVIQSVMSVTVQQQQAIDTFISGDRERLHSYADYFSRKIPGDPERVKELLGLFDDVDAIYLVMSLDEGWICGTSFDEVRQLEREDWDGYLALEGSGARDSYTGLYSKTPRFGYYERFTFADGQQGLIQKSYNRSKVCETFSLSFYNDQGFAYVVNSDGNILLRSTDSAVGNFDENIFEALSGAQTQQDGVDAFKAALDAQESGSLVFEGESGKYVYTYLPIKGVEGWYLISVINSDAIRMETDKILHSTQMAMWFLLSVLALCVVFVVLIWRTSRDIAAKDKEVRYQAKLFDVFISYIASNTNDVYMMLDQDTEQPEYISPNVERVLGVKGENLIRYIEDGDMKSDPGATHTYYHDLNTLRPGESAIGRETERINPKTGEHRYFVESAYCTEIEGHKKRVCYISDRTKERQAQDSLTEALHMAEAANEAKSSFLSSMSHDIRTPMNAIIGFLALMQDEADDPGAVREYAQRIDAASRHLLSLINDVLDMNKIESGSTTLNIEELNLAEIIEEINTIIRPQARAKEQTFDIFVSHLSYEHLLGDKLRINQILINLLSNAVKYTPAHGAIQMRVEELPQLVDKYSRIRFTIQDNGLGMSEEYLKTIFTPFTREESAVTREIQGTGLGMAITKNLVDLMGGVIEVESEPGKGSTFTVELELHIQDQEEEPSFWSDHTVKRMIVADDEEEACQVIVKSMAKTGVEVDYATDGHTAIEMMRKNREAGRPYDIILLDWKMPGLNGLETARLIRKNYPDKIPILLLTAYDWDEIEKEATEIGVDHFMPKPFFMTTFKEAIRRLMGSGEKKPEITDSDVVRGRRVLVVDDIEVNRIILVKILSSLGAWCDTAGDGQEALEKFEASEPGTYDLILMDVQMPAMNGYESTRAIRSGTHPDGKKVPIIAMTANAFVDDVRDAIESGMNAHIAKPVQIDNLKSTIQQVFEQNDGKS